MLTSKKYMSHNMYVRTPKTLLRVIFYAKYEKADLHKVVETQCQHLTMTQRNELLELLHKFEVLFNETLGTWKIDLVDLKLKEDVNLIFMRPYPVPKVQK